MAQSMGSRLMVENTIADVQKLERSVTGKSLPDLQIRLALRSCLKELRMLTADGVGDSAAPHQPAVPIRRHSPGKQRS
jgi:hypothetical protein